MEKPMDRSRRISGMVLLVMVLLFLGCTVLQFCDNRKNAMNTCGIMVDQLRETIQENEENLDQLQETLKNEYLVRAVMAADYIDRGWTELGSAEDFSQLAELLQVDEIHVFDGTGTIVAGSRPEYYGYTLSSGEQMAFFKPMLDDHSLALCQDVTPNTAEKKPMMYAMVWDRDETMLVQVGIQPQRLLQRMESSDMRHLVDRLPMIEGMTAFVVDNETDEVVCTTDDAMLGYHLDPADHLVGELPNGRRFQTAEKFHGQFNYLTFERMDDYSIAVSYTLAAANAALPLSMAEFALILTAAFLLLRHVTRRYVSYLEKQSQALAEANIVKTDFLRRMSHDIRTPLNGIRGMLSIASHDPEDLEKQADCRKKIMEASGYLLELVNNALNMNKLESGKLQLEREPFDLCSLLDETDNIIEMYGQEHAVSLIRGGREITHRRLLGSALHLRQILQNVGGNAVKYNRAGGSVRVFSKELSDDGTRAVFQFVCADTGRGMSREFCQRAFEPFSQEVPDARTALTGTGLGLAITKQLVELMGGSITLESELNVGTTVTITIPLEIDTACRRTQEETADADGAPLDGVRVLVAEDNDLNMEIACFILENAGLSVTPAWNGQEALEKFSAAEPGTFDLILMDVMMPVMDGLTAVRKIRSLPRSDAQTVPIFAMTANAFQDDIRQCREAGMNEHFPKPLQEQELLRAIRRYVRRDLQAGPKTKAEHEQTERK